MVVPRAKGRDSIGTFGARRWRGRRLDALQGGRTWERPVVLAHPVWGQLSALRAQQVWQQLVAQPSQAKPLIGAGTRSRPISLRALTFSSSTTGVPFLSCFAGMRCTLYVVACRILLQGNRPQLRHDKHAWHGPRQLLRASGVCAVCVRVPLCCRGFRSTVRHSQGAARSPLLSLRTFRLFHSCARARTRLHTHTREWCTHKHTSHVRTRTRTQARTHARTHARMHTSTHVTCVHIQTPTRTHARTQTRICACTCAQVFWCGHARAHCGCAAQFAHERLGYAYARITLVGHRSAYPAGRGTVGV